VRIREWADGLLSLGIRAGDTVGLMAPSSPQWLLFDYAIALVGGVSVPLFTNISPENRAFELADSGLRTIFVSGLEARAALERFRHKVERVIVDGEAPPGRGEISLDDLAALGRAHRQERPGAFLERAGALAPESLFSIIYTSGSTGVPKGVELTHANLISQLRGAAERIPLDPRTDVVLSVLPMAHIFERMVVHYHLTQGVPIYFADDVQNAGALMREVRPTVVTLVPRLLEKVHARMLAGLEEKKGLGRRIAMAAWRRANERAPGTAGHGPLGRLFGALVYRKFRAALGGRLRLAISGGAKLPGAIGAFFSNIAVPIYEGYGLTECSPVIAVNAPHSCRLGTVGPLFPGVEARLAPDGELQVRGPGIMRGYHKNPRETARVLDGEGWLSTGDLARLDEGFLTITGRKKELFKTSTGKYVSPLEIEHRLCESKYVDMAMIIAESRRFVSCLLFPDMDKVRAHLAREGSPLSEAEYAASPAFRALLQKVVDRVNKHLDHWEQIHRFLVIPETPTIAAEELTPTMKLRRHVLEAKYARAIEALYREEPGRAA